MASLTVYMNGYRVGTFTKAMRPITSSIICCQITRK